MHDKDGSLQISERINDFLIKGSLMVVSEPNLEEVPENVEFISFLSLIVEELKKGEKPKSQAALARNLGRTRATVHSAIKVLRRRGILRQDKLGLAPHLVEDEKPIQVDLNYQWEDERNR